MKHRIFFSVILIIVGFSLMTGCAKKEETPPAQAPATQTSAPAPATPVVPAPSAATVPASPSAVVEKDKVRAAHEIFVDAFNAAIQQGNGMDALQARIQAAENAKDACIKIRGELDDPADLVFLNKFIEGLQEYSDKGHAYVSMLGEGERLLSEIKEGQEALKKLPQKEQAQAITKLNEKTMRYNDLYKGPLPKQRDELEALGKDLLSLEKSKG
jgi:hypothetical protein